jgi:hypothetical protein
MTGMCSIPWLWRTASSRRRTSSQSPALHSDDRVRVTSGCRWIGPASRTLVKCRAVPASFSIVLEALNS